MSKQPKEESGASEAPRTTGEPAPPGSFRQLWSLVYSEANVSEKSTLLVALGALVASSATNLTVPWILQQVVDRASVFRPSNLESRHVGAGMLAGVSFENFLMGCTGFFLCGAAASFLRVYSLAMVKMSLARRLRTRLVHNVLRQDMAFFDERKNVGADTLVHLAKDVETVADIVTEKTARLLRGMNSTIGGACSLFYISPKLTLATLAVIPFVSATAMLFSRRAKRMAKALKAEIDEANSKVNERISNMKTVRLAGNEDQEIESYKNAMVNIMKNSSQNARADGTFMGGLGLAINMSSMAVLYMGGSLVQTGDMSVGSMTSFAFYSAMVGAGSASLASVYASMKQSMGMTGSLFNLLYLPVPAKEEREGAVPEKAVTTGPIVFDNVSFSYPSRPDILVLDKVSLTIEQGSAVAVVGPSGSGKSTLSMILCRMYEVKSGSVYVGLNNDQNNVDGKQQNSITNIDPVMLRSSIGVVDQEPTLFAMSIRENIRYGYESATDEEVEKAAREANAHEFIKSLPDGYDTQVGDSGDLLSGGQKQRVAIARAIVNNPSILVLDEATSALDPKSEKAVVEALGRVRKHRTVLVIAHRSSSYEWTDRIVHMVPSKGDNGGYTISENPL